MSSRNWSPFFISGLSTILLLIGELEGNTPLHLTRWVFGGGMRSASFSRNSSLVNSKPLRCAGAAFGVSKLFKGKSFARIARLRPTNTFGGDKLEQIFLVNIFHESKSNERRALWFFHEIAACESNLLYMPPPDAAELPLITRILRFGPGAI